MRTITIGLCVLACSCGSVDDDRPGTPDGAPRGDASGGLDGTTVDAAGGDGPVALGPWSAPAPLAHLSTPDEADSYPTLRGDGLELLFSSQRDGSTKIYRSRRFAITDPWGEATLVAELDVAGRSEGTPELSHDGRRLWFTAATSTSTTTWDIYTASRETPDAPWTDDHVVTELQSADADRSPQVSPDGLTLHFARGPTGNLDLHVATRDSDTAPWGNVRDIPRLSSATDEDSSTLTGDGTEIFFDTLRDGELAIYRSTRPVGGPWALPEPVGELAGGYRADITPDGRYMVLSMTNTAGNSDLYEARR